MPKPGARVLIQGGSGGVGHFAIQLAKVHFKAHVVATGGPSNQAFMEVCSSGRLALKACAEAISCMVPAAECDRKLFSPTIFTLGAIEP